MGYTTVEAAFDNILSELQTANVVFAAVWVYDYDKQSEAWNITGDNYRGYMLDKLEAANAALNQ